MLNQKNVVYGLNEDEDVYDEELNMVALIPMLPHLLFLFGVS